MSLRWVKLGVLARVIGGALAVGMSSPQAVPATTVSLASEDGQVLLSVRAEAEPLGVLLSEVARLASFEVVEVSPAEETVSEEFSCLPLPLALDRLLSGTNFVAVYEHTATGGTGKLERIIVLGSRAPAERVAAVSPFIPAADGGDLLPVSEEPPHVVPDGAEALRPDATVEQLLRLAADRDPRMRVVALEALTLHGEDERARRTLVEGTLDPDLNIRSVALGLLGPFVGQWVGAEDAVMVALSDPVALVRQLALRTMWEASRPRASDALHSALQDRDAGVRALAHELLRDSFSADPSG
jgi:hypothetical protein